MLERAGCSCLSLPRCAWRMSFLAVALICQTTLAPQTWQARARHWRYEIDEVLAPGCMTGEDEKQYPSKAWQCQRTRLCTAPRTAAWSFTWEPWGKLQRWCLNWIIRKIYEVKGRALQRPAYFTTRDQSIQTFKYLLRTSNHTRMWGRNRVRTTLKLSGKDVNPDSKDCFDSFS